MCHSFFVLHLYCKSIIKKRYAGKTVEELNVEFEKLKNEFLEAHKELQQKLNS